MLNFEEMIENEVAEIIYESPIKKQAMIKSEIALDESIGSEGHWTITIDEDGVHEPEWKSEAHTPSLFGDIYSQAASEKDVHGKVIAYGLAGY